MISYYRYIKNILISITIFSFLSGCNPSSRTQRYNHPKNKNTSIPKSTDDVNISSAKRFDDKGDDSITVVQDIPDSNESEFDETPVEEIPFDKSKFVTHYEKLKDFNVALTPREKILFEVVKYLDTPYKYGGNTDSGIDCSAFTKQVYENSVSVELPRSAREQYGIGNKINKDDLKFGDLVFFNTRRSSNPGHVGIYLGDNQFAHASRKLGVTVSSLDEKYYKTRYTGARRVMTNSN